MIDSAVTSWLEELICTKDITIDEDTPNKKTLLYELSRVIIDDVPTFYLTPVSASLRKNGTLGKYSEYRYSNSSADFPRYFKTIDHGIVTKMAKLVRVDYHNRHINCKLDGQKGAILLEEALSTERCFWKSSEDIAGKMLTLGPKRKIEMGWEINFDATQQFNCLNNKDSSDEYFVIPTVPIWYIDTKHSNCGLVENKIKAEKLSVLLKSPPIAYQSIEEVNKILKKSIDDKSSLPKILPKAEIYKVTPVPHLHFSSATLCLYYSHYSEVPVAQLLYNYDGVMLPYSNDMVTEMSIYKDGSLVEIPTDFEKHEETLKLFKQFNLLPVKTMNAYCREFPHYFSIQFPIHGRIIEQRKHLALWEDFIENHLQELRDKGIVITSDTSFPLSTRKIIHLDEDWQASIENQSGTDWFDFEIGVMVNGKKISLLPVLASFIKNTNNALDVLEELDEDGTVNINISEHEAIALPVARIKKILSFLKDLHSFDNYKDGKLPLSKAEAMALAQLQENEKLVWQGSAKWQELVQKIKQGFAIAQVEEPKGLTVKLRNYQHEGLQWLQFLQDNQFGGILADDMGLGKTIQTLALIMLAKERGLLNKPVLIIAPTSVVFNWIKEIERFTPSLKALLLHGSDRKKVIDSYQEYDIILSTYPLILRDKAKLTTMDFYMIVLDEAQYIKNAQAKVTQVIHELKSEHRLCLTGTPMENHLGELWSLFHFLMPGFLGNKKQFTEFYRTPIEKEHDAERQQGLVRKIRPFILRRTKDNVLQELPEKTTITQYVELEQEQRDLYETIRVSVQSELMKNIATNGLHKSQIAILDALLKLRQVCCDPRLLKSTTARNVQASAKLDALKIMLKEMVEEGRKILLFSQFVEMLELIEKECQEMGIAYLKLTGESTNRDALVDKFQTGNIPIFLISLRAGGTGLNLTAADTVIQYDPWWNPAVEQQAASRAHRMGQDKPVFVYKMISKGTVEEKILSMQDKKQALADRLLSNQGAISTKLEMEDIDMLFSSMV